ncbi:BspA family leucine-rich repeat surface protein [Helicobacter cinaedi]|uniref:BspA family leucine-rich repeat surface protein n=1 Tax=Helicobacter cinaedi TaxID=213 RepID=UPI000D7BFBB1|nr:BspA family leucine-rich repeat surface protein [Helicobacter cinaedi]BBB20189.1 chitinase [Helicobacter cinaedi]
MVEYLKVKIDSLIKVNGKYQPKDFNELLALCKDDNIHLGDIDTSRITAMDSLFYLISQRKDFSGIESWDVSQVTSMSQMFQNNEFFNADISGWNVSKVADMRYMFYGAKVFNQDLSKWELLDSVDLGSMFENVKSLEILPQWEIRHFAYSMDIFKGTKLERQVKKMIKEFLQNTKRFTPLTKFQLSALISYKHIKLSDIDVSHITDMSYLFHRFNDKRLAFIEDSLHRDFSGIESWDVSNVENMQEMFSGYEYFNADISGWNVAKVKNMQGMFKGAKLFNQDLSRWNVGNVEDMCEMFSRAISFNADISSWNVAKVRNMKGMFEGATLFNQDLSKWKLLDSVNLDLMFYRAKSLQTLPKWEARHFAYARDIMEDTELEDETQEIIESFLANTRHFVPLKNNHLRSLVEYEQVKLSDIDVSHITDMSYLFLCSQRKDFSGIESWDVSKVKNMDHMFASAKSFNADISKWNVSNVKMMQAMFKSASSFNADISSWNVAKVRNMDHMFAGAMAFNQPINQWNVSQVKSMRYMFEIAPSFNADISKWNVSSVTRMEGMFKGAESFNADISSWDVSNVNNMDRMFAETRAFNQDLSKWNLADSVSVDRMFYDARGLRALPKWGNGAYLVYYEDVVKRTRLEIEAKEMIEKFLANTPRFYPLTGDMLKNLLKHKQISLAKIDVSMVQRMDYLFQNSKRKDFSGIESWDVSNVTSMHRMFHNAKYFNADISSWNVSNVDAMYCMFDQARLFNQDLSKWDVRKVRGMECMFRGARAFRQDLEAWGDKINYEFCRVESMFEDSPLEINPPSWYIKAYKQRRGIMNRFKCECDDDNDEEE